MKEPETIERTAAGRLGAAPLLGNRFLPVWPSNPDGRFRRYRIIGYNPEGRPIMEEVVDDEEKPQPGEEFHYHS